MASVVQVSIVSLANHGGDIAAVAQQRFKVAPQVITASGTSQQFTNVEAVQPGDIWRVAVAGDTHVYVAFGENPTASATTGYLCPASGIYEFRVGGGTTDTPHIAAVINVA